MMKVQSSRVVAHAVTVALFLLAGGASHAWAQTSPTPSQSQPGALTVEAPPSGSADATATGPSIPPPPAAANSQVTAPSASAVTAPKPVGPAPSAAPPPNVTSAAVTNSAVYGVAARARWISIPKWFLNFFTQANVPLSSYHVGAEFFRRKGDYDLVLGLSYQSMSPPDGNWLGPTPKEASIDTDYVQFRGLGLISFDVALLWHQAFTDWMGMHYGGGIGIGVVTGKMLRTSSWGNCTKANTGDVSKCHPSGIYPINEAQLQASEGGIDTPDAPHRFKDNNIPSVIPVLNIILGLDFKLPTIPGMEIRIDGGFFDAFYLGGAIGYVFL